MLDTFHGLPVHALLVHATVILVPTAAISVALAAVWPRFRAWIGWFPPVAAVVSVVLVQLTAMSGEELYDRFEHAGVLSRDIQHHKDLGQQLILFVIPLAVLAVAAYLLQRRGNAAKAVTTVVAVLCVVSALGVAAQVARIGEAGAKAVWKPTVDGLSQAR